MAKINLLPWREDRRKQRNKEAQTVLVAAALFGALIVLGSWFQVGKWTEGQEARNNLLREEIRIADEKIKEIEALERTRQTLLQRKEVIEQLQSDRSVMVHLFDELVRRTPEGVRLSSIKQNGQQLTLEGLAESNARVSEFMRVIDQSQWLGNSDLSIVEASGEDRKERYVFTLVINLRKPSVEGEEGSSETEAAGATAGATP
jgi:type IV pilus assembly protein PilN